MVNLQAIEQTLRGDPNFAQLDYKNQTYVRMVKYSEVLKTDQDFIKMNPQNKNHVLGQLVLQPPVLKDKNLEGWIQQLYIQYRQETQPGESSLKSSRPGEYSAAEQMNRFQQDFKLHNTSVLLNVLDKKLIGPLLESVNLTSMGTKALMSEEAPEIVDFFDTLLSQDKQQSRLAAISGTLAGISGELVDSAVLYALTAGTLAAPHGLGKLAVSAGKAISGSAATMFLETVGNLTGATLHAAVGGLIGYTQHIGQDIINRNALKSQPFQEILFNNAKYFGQYMAGDVIFNMLAGVLWPFSKQLMQNFLPGKSRGAIKPWVDMGPLSEGEWAKMVDDVVGMRGFNKNLLNRLPKSVQEVIISGSDSMAMFSHVRGLTQPEEIFKTAAFAKGFMARQTEAGWKMRPIFGDGKWQPFKNLPQAQNWLLGEMGKIADYSDDAARLLGAATRKARIQSVFTGILGEGAEKEVNVLTRMIAPVGGSFDPGKVKAFTQAFLKAKGAGDDIYRTVKVLTQGDQLILQVKGKQIASIAKEAIDEVDTIKTLTGAIETAYKGKLNRSHLAAHLAQKYQQSINEQQLFTPAWLRYGAEKEMGGQLLEVAGGKFQLTLKNGTVQIFDNANEVGYQILRHTMDENRLASYLAHDRGLKLKRTSPEGPIQVFQGKQKLYEAADMETLLKDHADLLPKVPDYLGPELTFVDDNVRVVNYIKSTATGRWDNLLKHLDSFYKQSGKRTQVILSTEKGGRMTLMSNKKQLEVFVPEIGHRKVFSNIKEAKEYLEGGWKSWGEMTQAATAKGMRLVPYQGRYLVAGQGKNSVQVVNNADDLAKVLRDVPTPEWMPELSGLSDDVTMNFDIPEGGAFTNLDLITPESIDATSPLLFKGLRKVFGDRPFITKMEKWHEAAQQLYRPPDAYMAMLVEKGVGDPTLLQHFRGIKNTLGAIEGQDQALITLVNSVWRDKGKWIPIELRRKIAMYMDTPLAAKTAKAAELGLTPDDLRIAERVRYLYGTSAEKGLAGRYGIDAEMFQPDYLSRIRKFYMENPGKKYYAGDTRRFIQDAFGGTPPKNLTAFFKHLRVNEVASLAMETDPLEIMSKYVRIGNREQLLGPIWREADKYVRQNITKIDPLQIARFELFRSQVMGVPQGVVEKLVQITHGRIWKQLGIKEKALNRDLIDLGMNWAYLSSMAFRPWLAVRNVFQVGTTLAPRVGNEYVVQAIRKLAKDKTGAIYNSLRAQGVIPAAMPVPGGDVLQMSKLMRRLQNAGLRWYKNSDEWERAVAYVAAELRFQNAAAKYTKGILGKGKVAEEHFMELSGLSTMAPDIRNSARGMIAKGQWGSAASLYGKQMAVETMFDYTKGAGPVAFRGMIGKLFGMMGNYSVYYVENIKRALKYATPAQKIAYATQFVGNSMLFYGAFKTLGINAQNFLPWQPALFTGGPIYNLMNETLASLSPSYGGRQARASLFGMTTVEGKLKWQPGKSQLLSKWLPTFAVNSIFRAVEHANDGDYYGAFLTATGYPYKQDFLQDLTI